MKSENKQCNINETALQSKINGNGEKVKMQNKKKTQKYAYANELKTECISPLKGATKKHELLWIFRLQEKNECLFDFFRNKISINGQFGMRYILCPLSA